MRVSAGAGLDDRGVLVHSMESMLSLSDSGMSSKTWRRVLGRLAEMSDELEMAEDDCFRGFVGELRTGEAGIKLGVDSRLISDSRSIYEGPAMALTSALTASAAAAAAFLWALAVIGLSSWRNWQRGP